MLVAPKPVLQGERTEEAEGGSVEQKREGKDVRSESQTSVEEACAPGQPVHDTHNSERLNKATGKTSREMHTRLSSAEVYGSLKYDMLSGATTALKGLHGRRRQQAGGPHEDGLKECGGAVSCSDHSTLKPRNVIIGGKSGNSIWPDQPGEHRQGGSINPLSTANHRSERGHQLVMVHGTCCYLCCTVLHYTWVHSLLELTGLPVFCLHHVLPLQESLRAAPVEGGCYTQWWQAAAAGGQSCCGGWDSMVGRKVSFLHYSKV